MPTTDDDTRPRVPLNGKAIDLAQLADELGAPLCANDEVVVVADPDSPVTAKQLAAALAAHLPAPPADPAGDFIAAVRGATTLAALKQALITTLPDVRP